MVPNLNKWNFTKLHRKKRIISLGKGNKGKTFSIYNAGLILTNNNLITIKQFESVRKFINKKLKAKDRVNRKNFKVMLKKTTLKKKENRKTKEKTVIIRTNFNLGLTKKPLQVRMGKGKGAPVDWVYPFAKNRVFLEFLTKKVKFSKLSRIFKLVENKLSVGIKIRRSVVSGKKIKKDFKKFTKLVNLKCVKEL